MRPLMVVLVLGLCATNASSALVLGQDAAQSQPLSFIGNARRALAHGRLDEAEALAKSRPAGDADAAAILGLLSIRRGEYDEAIAALEPAASAEPLSEAALELALLQRKLGRSGAGDQALNRIFREASSAREPDLLLRAARAAHALGRAHDANAIFRAASALGSDPAIDTAWGRLFLDTYNNAEALRSFQDVLKADPSWAPAHVGLARTLTEENPPAAAAAASKALEIDPQLADAHLMLAELDLDNTRFDAARERIRKVLDANPAHLDARALLGAIAYVRDDQVAFEAAVSRVLAINPAFGEVYRVAADLAARNYRFDEAVALTRQAIALDPLNMPAVADLGMHLMRTGDEAEARRVLERAFRADPFDRITYNLLSLLDTLERFEVVREGDLVFKFHPEEADVLREYAIPLTQEAFQKLSKKYRFTPKGPILIEVFPQHDDFAVRNLGLPGLIGALGACFGRVVSMDSPRAKEPGEFSWQATLWHELAHVVTLQMSNQRIPRWLTEGISEYEEALARPAWGRQMTIPFAQALERGQVIPVKDLNSGFTRPETIALAYYQASLLVEHIVATHGIEALGALVRAYGEGLEGEAAIQKGLGSSFDQLQVSFTRMLDERYGPARDAIRDFMKTPLAADLAGLRVAAATNLKSYQAQLALGAALAEEGDKAAFEYLERAAALVPTADGSNSPHAIMGQLAEQLGDTDRAIKEYEALLAIDHTALDSARRLAEVAGKAGHEEALALAHQRIVELDPFDAQGHSGLGRLALKRHDAATATREFKAALAVGPADRASAHCDLGESYLLAGRMADAKREALAALEIAPTFERAQELLLKTIDGRSDPRARQSPAGGRRP